MKVQNDFVRPARWKPPVSNTDNGLLHDITASLLGKTLLEFGPGDSTDIFLGMGLQVTSCEHSDKWYEVAKERFKDRPNFRLLKYENEMPVPLIEGMGAYEKFDIGFVDSPQGYHPLRKVFPGFEDCSRLNTALYALERCENVIMHDVLRGLERATLGKLHLKGYEFEILSGRGSTGIARIWQRQKPTSSIEPSEILVLSPKEQVPMQTP